MGYYTEYRLSVENGDEAAIRECLTEAYGGYDPFSGETKWYECNEDCIKVSKMFPDATIIITGIGEEQPDMWRAWFRNGKHKCCEATIEYIEPEW